MAAVESKEDFVPSNEAVNSLLTDLYQITMAYAYWKNGTQDTFAVFDLFFRKCPFKGEYCIFGGLQEVMRFIQTFGFTPDQIEALKTHFPTWETGFWEYLSTLDASNLRILAQREGSVVFPKVPLYRLEGPLIVCQLIETTLLNLTNYSSLVATNAARIRHAVGPDVSLLEFGLRRAQGPDGAMSASRYAFLGGFNGTSNVQAGIQFGVPIKGTHAHSFVSSFQSLDEVKVTNEDLNRIGNFKDRVLHYRVELGAIDSNDGELAAFIAYAHAFPDGFLALVDTYDTLSSGVPNFLAVALALNELGLSPRGIRLDSGDLAYLSVQARQQFQACSEKFSVDFANLTIVASNDINEEVLYALKDQGHSINAFGIGTHLVTCKRQPALGCVYKLVEIDGAPRIKLSQDVGKMTIPGKKMAYRLYNANNEPVLDFMGFDGIPKGLTGEPVIPTVGEKVLCHHPFNSFKRCRVTAHRVVPLLNEVWNGQLVGDIPDLNACRTHCLESVASFRHDITRFLNPTPYKVSVETNLRTFIQELWQRESPITEL